MHENTVGNHMDQCTVVKEHAGVISKKLPESLCDLMA